MGLDAFVPCRCWQEGRTSEPPAPRTQIVWSDGELDLTVPYDGNEELYSRFDAWKYDCCAHQNMEYAAERINNWTGYRQFQWALGTLGWDRFPVLHRILPQANGGEAVPADAAGALVDLGNFMAVDRIGSLAELYDGNTDNLIATESPAYGGAFMLGPSYEVSISGAGLVVLDRPSGQEVFRAQRIAQRPTDGGTWLSDMDRPERGETRIGTRIGGGASLLLTRSRECRPGDFVGTVEALTTIFRASVEIDSPVRWT